MMHGQKNIKLCISYNLPVMWFAWHLPMHGAQSFWRRWQSYTWSRILHLI